MAPGGLCGFFDLGKVRITTNSKVILNLLSLRLCVATSSIIVGAEGGDERRRPVRIQRTHNASNELILDLLNMSLVPARNGVGRVAGRAQEGCWRVGKVGDRGYGGCGSDEGGTKEEFFLVEMLEAQSAVGVRVRVCFCVCVSVCMGACMCVLCRLCECVCAHVCVLCELVCVCVCVCVSRSW